MPETPDALPVRITTTKLADLVEDDNNANLGTLRGLDALEDSIGEYGFIESGLLDRNNNIISGNKRKEAAAKKMGPDADALIFDIDGSKPIYFRLNTADLHSDDPVVRERTRRIAYAMNRIHQLSLRWDPKQLAADEAAGLNLSGLFLPEELAEIRSALSADDIDFDDFEKAEATDVRYRVVIDSLERAEAEELKRGMPNARIEQYRV